MWCRDRRSVTRCLTLTLALALAAGLTGGAELATGVDETTTASHRSRTAVLFRTHLLDATVLELLRRLVADLRASCRLVLIFDADVIDAAAAAAFAANASSADDGAALELFGVSTADYVAGFQSSRAFSAAATRSSFQLKHDNPEVGRVVACQQLDSPRRQPP